MKQEERNRIGVCESPPARGRRFGRTWRITRSRRTSTRRASWKFGWRGRTLTDAVLAEYIRFLHAEGKSPATINLVVSAVKWMTEYRGADTAVGDITARTLSEIRGEGKERERRQVDGLTWDDVERVCAAAESSDTAAGLRDAAMISLMSDCLLRISEAVAVNVEDVQAEGLQVYGKKAGAEKRGEILYICESTRRLIQRYRTRAGIEAGSSDRIGSAIGNPLFRRIRFQNHVTEDRLGVKGARGSDTTAGGGSGRGGD